MIMRNLIVTLAVVVGVLCLGFIVTQDAGERALNLQPPAILVSYAAPGGN